MTPEAAACHEWLNDIKHQSQGQSPKIIDRSRKTPSKSMSVGDEANDNDRGKV